MSSAVLAAPVRPRLGFFQQPSPAYLILGSFLILTLPLTLLAILQRHLLDRWHVGLLYVIGLGTTHFVLTFTVYLQSANLRYFNSTWTNRVLYFLIPVAIFVFFDLFRALRVATVFPAFSVAVFWTIRALDFQHFGRQTYGVFQLFKGRSTCPFPAWARRAENLYFFGLTALLMLTYLSGGHFDATHPASWVVGGVVLVLLGAVVASFVVAWKRGGRPSALVAPAAYFLLQSISGAMAIYSSSLYLVCLAVHYVEYHVLMVPRCFHVPLDERSRTDRLFASLRRNPAIFYLVLLGISGVVTLLTWQTMGMVLAQTGRTPENSYVFLIALFDGLFVFHYFIESFIWKFSVPHYRHMLAPLYFGQRLAPVSAAAPQAGALVASGTAD